MSLKNFILTNCERIYVCFLIILGFINLNNLAWAQTIDSANANYDIALQELEVRVKGQIAWMDPTAIVDIQDTSFNDSVVVIIHFLPCQTLPTFINYDTTFVLNISLSLGTKHAKILSFHDEDLNPNHCFYNPNPGYWDTAYVSFNVTMATRIYEKAAFTIFPNPTSGISYIESDQRVENIEVFNSRGMSLKELVSPGSQIDLGALPEGLYFLKIEIDGASSFERVLVQ